MKLFSVARPDEDRLVGQDNQVHVAARGAAFWSQVWWVMNAVFIAFGVRMLWIRVAGNGIHRYGKHPLHEDEQDIYFA